MLIQYAKTEWKIYLINNFYTLKWYILDTLGKILVILMWPLGNLNIYGLHYMAIGEQYLIWPDQELRMLFTNPIFYLFSIPSCKQALDTFILKPGHWLQNVLGELCEKTNTYWAPTLFWAAVWSWSFYSPFKGSSFRWSDLSWVQRAQIESNSGLSHSKIDACLYTMLYASSAATKAVLPEH